jgi:osmoprotectant transport system substrate-binding protein
MRTPRMLLFFACLSAAVAACSSGSGSTGGTAAGSSSPPITIGSTNFYEQVIVANLYSGVLRHAGIHTTLRTNLGTREAVEPALAAGQLDLYPDYAGSLLIFLKPNDTEQATQLSTDVPALKSALGAQGATVLDAAPAVDTNIFAVTKSTASKYHLTTLSSLAPVASQLTLGAPPECPQRQYCLLGLQSVYGIHFKGFTATDESGPITVADMKNGAVQVAELFSSDADVLTNGFVQLTDDKHLQPADHLIPVIRKSVDSAAAQTALNQLSAKLTTEQLTELNVKVSVDHLDPATVASQWLKSEGLT